MITWKEIESRTTGAKDGLVDLYFKYMQEVPGMTLAAFAQHVDIPERTFQGWIVQCIKEAAKTMSDDELRDLNDAIVNEIYRPRRGKRRKAASAGEPRPINRT